MIEELLKHCRRGRGGQKLLTSEQKRLIVEQWRKNQQTRKYQCWNWKDSAYNNSVENWIKLQ